MTKASPEDALEMLAEASEEPLEQLVDTPEGYALYEVVYQTDGEPEEVRRYIGEDMVPRVISLIRGDVDSDVDAMDAVMDPDEPHTRVICTTSEDAITSLEGALDMGEFKKVVLEREDGDGDE